MLFTTPQAEDNGSSVSGTLQDSAQCIPPLADFNLALLMPSPMSLATFREF